MVEIVEFNEASCVWQRQGQTGGVITLKKIVTGRHYSNLSAEK